MPQNIRDVMTSNPCTIAAEKSVAYAAKMMQEEDVVLAGPWRATTWSGC